MKPTPLLVVDDDETFRRLLVGELERRGFPCLAAAGVTEARALVDQQALAVALVDLRLQDGDGLELVSDLRERQPRLEVIVLTGHGTIDTAIEAMRRGAFDYLRKPCPVRELEVAVRKALEHRQLIEQTSILRDGLAPTDPGPNFVGRSAAYQELTRIIDRVAPTDSTVLVLGETGVGKDLVARLIHARSQRSHQPFVVVECAALHSDPLHNELFGHDRGAYTGAGHSKHGLFEVAHQGTLFLDEIGDVSLETQTKLLRVLETGTFRRVGGTQEIQVDVRIVAATNRDLDRLIERGLFRQDLYYRLHAIRIEVPPLRARSEDVSLLVDHFLQRLNARFGQKKRVAFAAMQKLQAYRWPGNVRQLHHLLEQVVILSEAERIDVDELPPDIRGASPEPDTALLPLSEVERQHIQRVLDAVDGNRAEAARILEISERTLYRKLRE